MRRKEEANVLITHQPLFPEVNANSGDEFVAKGPVSVLIEKARFAYTRVAQGQELD